MNCQIVILFCFGLFELTLLSRPLESASNQIKRFGVKQNGTKVGIVGGYTAGEGAYPYMVSLRIENFHLCGASIIDRYWILTAAQCVFGQDPLGIKLFVGTNHLNSSGIWYGVTEIVYKGYNPKTMDNDIALLRLSDPITYNAQIQPIELSRTEPSVGNVSLFTGWGSTYAGSFPSESLQYIILRVFDRATCRAVWFIYSMNVTDQMICTLNGYGQGTCQGDTGGPLVVDGKQVAIASFGQPCAVGIPDVYTNVAFYYDWIHNITNIKL